MVKSLTEVAVNSSLIQVRDLDQTYRPGVVKRFTCSRG